MRKVILMMLLAVMSSSAMAEWVRDLTINEQSAAIDEMRKMVDWLIADGANKSSPLHGSDASCSDQHKYIEEALQNDVKKKENLHGMTAEDCDKDIGMAKTHYLRALQNNSYAALMKLTEIKKKENPSQFVLTKPYPPKIGMSKEQVKDCHWGNPRDKKKTTTQNGTTEVWIYAGNSYIFFDAQGLVEEIRD